MYWFFVILLFLLAGIKNGKSKKYKKVSIIIPAYNEEETVAKVIGAIKKVSCVDEIIVVNDGSTDNTENEALNAGARVINHEVNKGKGEALFTGYKQAECDIIAFIDADIYNLTPSKVEAMIKPILLEKADITKTKFSRVSGRVTELTAKPLLNFFFPEISFEQPLSGQFAARKEILKKINFEKDYGVDVGIVIDADVFGITIMEVDIGEIEHDMSPLGDLNLMANEVVRTIMSRANKYGRVTMIDDIGNYIRMAIVGLSLVILGLFTIFFVNTFHLAIGVLISLIGLILSIYYIVKVIIQSISMFRKTPRGNLFRSFIKVHFPMIISIIILLIMISTFIGAAHYENGVLSIEPNSRNLIIYADDTPIDNTISVRGPYTIGTAAEDEYDQIRMPADAMMTLGINVGDELEIKKEVYIINETRSGEPDVLRLPIEAKKALGVEDGDIIQNSRLKEIFKNSYATHTYEKDDESFKEKFIVSSRNKNASTFEVFVNDVAVANSTGILKYNYTYNIAVNGEEVTSFVYLNDDNITVEDYNIEIVFRDTNSTSIKQFVNSNHGNFLDFDI